MTITYKPHKIKSVVAKLLAAKLLLFLVAVMVFSIFYLLSGYKSLVVWFTGLGGCFYRQEYWTHDFFTPSVKAAGNVYCTIALVIAIVGLLPTYGLLIKKGKWDVDKTTVTINVADIFLATVCIVVAVISWQWGSRLIVPTYDEVFSAQNCAGMHPFQTIAYYMLPNNHIFFNLLNNVFFHSFADKVVSGKLISQACYCAVILVVFIWMKSLLQNRWLAALAATVMAIQFPVWGFGFEARGYELLGLLEWVAFIAIFRYLAIGDKRWLWIMALASAAGYFTIPTFLYFHVTVVAFACITQMMRKQLDLTFWKYQVITMAAVFMLYLPCLCFSGYKSITANQYVTGQGYHALVATILPTFQNYSDYCFGNIIAGHYWFDLLLFFLPLCLLFYRNNKNAFSLGEFYILLWGGAFLLTLAMKIFPIDRALIGHFSITLALVVYTIYLLLGSLQERLRLKLLRPLLLPVLLVLAGINFVKKDKQYAGFYICHFEMNPWHDTIINDGINIIPAGSTIAFSDESFYWYYLCRNMGYKTRKCIQGNETWFVKSAGEAFPVGMEDHYAPVKLVARIYTVYKHR